MSCCLNGGLATSPRAAQAPEEPVPEPTPQHNEVLAASRWAPRSLSGEKIATETTLLAEVPAWVGSVLPEAHISPVIESTLISEIDEGGIQVGGLSLPSPIILFLGDVAQDTGLNPDSNSGDEDSSHSFDRGAEFEPGPGLTYSADVYLSGEESFSLSDSAEETVVGSEEAPQIAENVHLAESEVDPEAPRHVASPAVAWRDDVFVEDSEHPVDDSNALALVFVPESVLDPDSEDIHELLLLEDLRTGELEEGVLGSDV